MGRKTYEFGYLFGLKPGDLAYPHMTHYIFSNQLRLDHMDPKLSIKRVDLAEIEQIKNQPGSDIYLCGGGQFCGWLLENEMIDFIKLKLNPFISSQGSRLFENTKKRIKLKLL